MNRTGDIPWYTAFALGLVFLACAVLPGVFMLSFLLLADKVIGHEDHD